MSVEWLSRWRVGEYVLGVIKVRGVLKFISRTFAVHGHNIECIVLVGILSRTCCAPHGESVRQLYTRLLKETKQ